MSEENSQNQDSFDEYLRQSEPHKQDKVLAWKTAIGLQAVDGLSASEYLIKTAKRHIDGDISIDEAHALIKSYYESKTQTPPKFRAEEADKVSVNIAKLLSEHTFSFSPAGYLNIHKRIFSGVFKFAGQIRDYNISKKEWVLRGDTIYYAGSDDIRPALEHDLFREKEYDYAGLSPAEIMKHLVRFTADLWQIHAFGEGNTRTTAVFLIKYLRTLGFSVDNSPFEEHSWYFRNALVRANYKNYQRKINPETKYLEAFFRNLLFGEQNELKNRYLIIEPSKEVNEMADRTSTGQVPDMLVPENPNIFSLIKVLGSRQQNVKELMLAMKLKHRETFLNNYLNPAIHAGFVRLLYPDHPKHPRQKYLLTVKGLAASQEMN